MTPTRNEYGFAAVHHQLHHVPVQGALTHVPTQLPLDCVPRNLFSNLQFSTGV